MQSNLEVFANELPERFDPVTSKKGALETRELVHFNVLAQGLEHLEVGSSEVRVLLIVVLRLRLRADSGHSLGLMKLRLSVSKNMAKSASRKEHGSVP